MDCPYVKYYNLQRGGHILPVYAGNRFQEGAGFFGSLWRGVFPLLKKGARYLGKQAVDIGSGILEDTAAGENLKLSARKRLREAGNTVRTDIMKKIQTGSGKVKRIIRRKKSIKRKPVKKPVRKRTVKSKAPSKKKRISKDIFF